LNWIQTKVDKECHVFIFCLQWLTKFLQNRDNSIEIFKNEMWKNGRSNAHMKLELI